MVQDIL